MSVVISPSLVLSDIVSGGDVINGNNPIIGYNNLVTEGVLSSTTAAAANPVTNLANNSTYHQWIGTSSVADEYITMELDTVDTIDYVGIAKHNFYTAQIPVSLEIHDGSNWVEVISDFIPQDDNAIIMRFTPQAVTDIRIRLQPGNAVPQAAVVYAGTLLVLQRRIYVGHSPVTMAKITAITTGKSESGNFLGRIVRNRSAKTTVSMMNVTPEWVRTYIKPFIDEAQEIPFFFAWRPLTYPHEVGFCWLMNDPIPQNALSNGMMKLSFDLGGIA